MDTVSCAHCGSGNTHHFSVEVFHRKEDESLGNYVSIATPGSWEDDPIPQSFGINLQSGADLQSLGNPSARRHGVVVKLICEHCERISSFSLAQHKGDTLVEVTKA